jgi:hypothetical protein
MTVFGLATGRAPRSKGGTVTTPASGAGSAADLPGYAPIPRSALGPALNDQGFAQPRYCPCSEPGTSSAFWGVP